MELCGDACRRGALDQSASADDNRRGRGLGGRVVVARRGPRRQRAWVGVDAQTDLASPFLDEGGEPVGERCAQPLTFAFKPAPAENFGTRPAAIVIRSPVRGFTPCLGPALGDAELAEAGEADLTAARKRVGDSAQDRLDGIRGGLLAGELAGDAVYELSLGQCPFLLVSWVGRNITAALDGLAERRSAGAAERT